jgi:hypothetical protein
MNGRQTSNRARLSRWLAFALSLALVVFAGWLARDRFNAGQFWMQIASVGFVNFVLMLAIITIGYAGGGLRFWQIMRSENRRSLNLPESIALGEASYLAGYFAPVGGAADMMRAAYLVANRGVTLRGTVIVSVLDRLVGAISIAAVGLLLLPLQIGHVSAQLVASQALSWAAFLAIAIVVVLAPGFVVRLKPQWADRLSGVRHLVRRQAAPKPAATLALSAGLALGAYAALLYLMGAALGLSPQANLLLASGAPLILFVQNFPLVYAGWGAREAAFALIASHVPGFDMNTMLAMSVLIGLGHFVAALPGAAIIMVLMAPWRTKAAPNSLTSVDRAAAP